LDSIADVPGETVLRRNLRLHRGQSLLQLHRTQRAGRRFLLLHRRHDAAHRLLLRRQTFRLHGRYTCGRLFQRCRHCLQALRCFHQIQHVVVLHLLHPFSCLPSRLWSSFAPFAKP
jgi:hypothetical protein